MLFYVHRSHARLIRVGRRGDGCVWVGGWGGGVAYLWIARPCAPTCKDGRDRQPPPEQRCSKRWGRRQCAATCVLSNMLLQRLCETVTESEGAAVETWSKRQSNWLCCTSLFTPFLDYPRNEWTTVGEADKTEQIQANVVTYTTKHKEQWNTSAFDSLRRV